MEVVIAVEVDRVTKVYTVRVRDGHSFFSEDIPSGFLSVLIWRLLGEEVRCVALDNVSLKVKDGEFFGLLGPNGSGKTTLLRIVAGLTPPTSGTVKIFGNDVEGREAHRFVNYVPGALAGGAWMTMGLSVYSNLLTRAKLLGVPQHRVREVMRQLGLTEFAHRPVGTLSSGMMARLEVAAALLKDAPVLLLDEPTAGFSPEVEREFHERLREVAREEGRTLIYATHQLHFAERFFDRVAILRNGRIAAVGSPAELKARLGAFSTITVKVVPRKPAGELAELVKRNLGDVEGFALRRIDYCVYEVRVVCRSAEGVLPKLISTLVKEGALVRRVDVREPTLEDFYLSMVEGGAGEAG